MTIKTKKRNTKRTLKGGSSKSYSILSSASSVIKRSLSLKRVTDKKCNNEINKLKIMFQKLKEAYMTIEKPHKS